MTQDKRQPRKVASNEVTPKWVLRGSFGLSLRRPVGRDSAWARVGQRSPRPLRYSGLARNLRASVLRSTYWAPNCGTAPGHRPPANVASAEAPLVLLSSPCSYAATLPDLVHDLLPHVARGVVRSKSFCVVTRSGLRGLSPVCAFLRSDYRLDALHNALPSPVAFSVPAPPRGGLQRGDAAPKASNCSTGVPQLLRCP